MSVDWGRRRIPGSWKVERAVEDKYSI